MMMAVVSNVLLCVYLLASECPTSVGFCFLGFFFNVCLPLTHPLLETWPATQACALTGNQTGNPLVHRPALSPLSHTSQGKPVGLNRTLESFQTLSPSFSYLHYVVEVMNLESFLWVT